MKKCILCGVEKQLSEFVKDARKNDGTRKYCKQCLNLKLRKTPIRPEPKAGHKYCAMCGQEKPLSDFNYRMANGERKPFSYCKECERERDRNRYGHICTECGKEYRSGRKNSKTCRACHDKEVGKLGRLNLIKKNENQFGSNNHMYGVSRWGKENPNYNPEMSDDEREIKRITPEYKEWRKSVFERDSYTCQCCGYDKGHTLAAHHLDGYKWCIEKRTDINNGVTLCGKCHYTFHVINGYGNNTKEQFDSFIYHANTEVSNQMAQG